MAHRLADKNIAFLVTDGFEQVELTSPKEALEECGATCHIVSPAGSQVRAWNHGDWGERFAVDVALDEARVGDYDALVLPGGVMSPDKLRIIEKARNFVHAFFADDKPVAAICHGPWTLIDAGVVEGRTLTSYPTLKTDLTNAGASWVDREVVIDGNLVTSRKPDDLPAFNRETIELFAGNRPGRARRSA